MAIFDVYDPVSTKSLAAPRRLVLGAILVNQQDVFYCPLLDIYLRIGL